MCDKTNNRPDQSEGVLLPGVTLTEVGLQHFLGEGRETVVKRVIYGENDQTDDGVECVQVGNHFVLGQVDVDAWVKKYKRIQVRPSKRGGKRRCPPEKRPQ